MQFFKLSSKKLFSCMIKGLIIIDMSKSYRSQTYNTQEILDNQIKLIDAFNVKNLPIIIVTGDPNAKQNPVMRHLWGDVSDENPKLGFNELVPEIANAKYSKIIYKSQYDAFFRTDLEQYCKDNKIEALYFCGVHSGICVYFSAAGAAMREIQPYLVTDASSTERSKWHQKNCDDFKIVIGQLITTEQLIREL